MKEKLEEQSQPWRSYGKYNSGLNFHKDIIAMFVTAITVQYPSRQLRWKVQVHKPKPKGQKKGSLNNEEF